MTVLLRYLKRGLADIPALLVRLRQASMKMQVAFWVQLLDDNIGSSLAKLRVAAKFRDRGITAM